MRLINTDTLHMEVFSDSKSLPAYAILSHCWGSTSEEVSHQEYRSGHFEQQSIGWRKISKCCDLAHQEGLDWAWVDTCCIDKTSSAELAEAINSMYAWYERSAACYVFLPDVNENPEHFEVRPHQSPSREAGDEQDTGSLDNSRWFTRGWTLQELLAPYHVEFYNTQFECIGTKSSLSEALARITGIDKAYLDRDLSIGDASIAARMSWAANRETKLTEDIAYSLLGIFNVNMPLIYGEGDKAFMRLQLAIIAQNDDSSILAWNCNDLQKDLCGTLAPSPDCFTDSRAVVDIQKLRGTWDGVFESTNKGLHYWHALLGPEIIPAYLWHFVHEKYGYRGTRQIKLNCRDEASNEEVILHIARLGNKWYRAGVEKRQLNTICRYAYKICTTLLPFQRKYIATSSPDKSAAFGGGQLARVSASSPTSPAVYRLMFVGLLTILATAISTIGLDQTMLLRIALLLLAMETTPEETRVALPVIWIALGLCL